MYLLVTLLVGALILIHELGHFAGARLAGIRVARLSIGFGPKLWGFRRGSTDYWLAWIPLGGYVMPAIENEDDFFRIPIAKRLVFLIGGPLANFALPVVVLATMNCLQQGINFQGVFVAPVVQTCSMAWQIVASLPLLFSQPQHLSGVVGVVAQGSAMVGSGPAGLAHFLVIISLNLAVLNLLPIPVLDGGKIVMALLEGLWPSSKRLYVPLALVGLVILVGLMLYATALDVGRLII